MAATSGSSFHGAAAMCLLLLLLLAQTTTITASSVSGADKMFNGSCISAERDALLSFKAGITSDPSRRLRSWQGQDCCRWYGVSCSARTGHVVKLDLHNDFFQDDFFSEDPADLLSSEGYVVRWLRGQISSSLLALRHLKHLDLSGNMLGGHMPIPEFMGSLKSLTYLNLANMNFSGRVTPQLGNLTKLVHLDIHSSFILSDGYHYSSDISWLGSLHSLEHLDMESVNLSTAVNWVHSVNTLPNLRELYLPLCGLSNSVPSLQHRNLTVLEKLYLSMNNFNNPATPNWFWDVTSLKSLKIDAFVLSGSFPDELGNLTMLESLDMGYNNINGMIPTTLRNMCSLRMIRFSGININGDITDLTERLPNCSWNSLQVLWLEETNITGTTLKSLLNLTALRKLDISYNDLSGSVPVEIGALKNLTELDISYNDLTGSVPVEIGALKNLTSLYIEHNRLSGVISEDHFSALANLKNIGLSQTYLQVIVDSHWQPPFNLQNAYFSSVYLGSQVPNWLRWQSNISELDISNTGLIGRIPDWFWTTFSNARHLDLSYNQISGGLPLNLGFMSIKALHLQSNNLTGSVPQLPRSLATFDISNNSLDGQLPTNFGGPSLRVAVLFSNRITGIIPDTICQWPHLQILDLSNNLLTRGLPDCGRKELKQHNASMNNSRIIHTLLLRNNNLSGEFPVFLKQCKNLEFLDLTQNRFSGKLPTWISEDMPRLVILRLRSNNFSGHIPIGIMQLFSLHILDLANNDFSGVIPQSLKNLEALMTTTVVDSNEIDNPFAEEYLFGDIGYDAGMGNDDSFSLVIKGQVLDYTGNALLVTSIDLSCNKLAGPIPEEIVSLHGLVNLNLSWNYLSGNIPDMIGNLQALEALDLSNNQLSGEIPWSLSNLTSLSYMNVSYNNLSGRIPSGRQLDTLKADYPASMYIGNPGLCGHPLLKVCPGDQPKKEDPIRWYEDDKTRMDIYLGFIVGFLVGLWIIFCGLLFKRTWRYTYFSLFDKLYDKMHVFSVVTWQQWFRKQGTN